MAYNLAQSGLYDAATQLLDSVEGDVRGVLKLQQRAQAFKALVQLKKHLRQYEHPHTVASAWNAAIDGDRDDIEAASYFLEYLRPIRSFGDPEIQFEISLLEIDLLVKQEDYEVALQTVNKHIAALKRKTGAGKLFPILTLLRSVLHAYADTSGRYRTTPAPPAP